jgi:hypothetical protein
VLCLACARAAGASVVRCWTGSCAARGSEPALGVPASLACSRSEPGCCSGSPGKSASWGAATAVLALCTAAVGLVDRRSAASAPGDGSHAARSATRLVSTTRSRRAAPCGACGGRRAGRRTLANSSATMGGETHHEAAGSTPTSAEPGAACVRDQRACHLLSRGAGVLARCAGGARRRAARHERTSWVVSDEGKGVDLVLEVHNVADEKKDHDEAGRLRFFYGDAAVPEAGPTSRLRFEERPRKRTPCSGRGWPSSRGSRGADVGAARLEASAPLAGEELLCTRSVLRCEEFLTAPGQERFRRAIARRRAPQSQRCSSSHACNEGRRCCTNAW